MDKEQNLNKKECVDYARLSYVRDVAQKARDSIAQLFTENHLKTNEVIFALAGICGSMTEEISVQVPGLSKDEVKEKFIFVYESYLSCEQ